MVCPCRTGMKFEVESIGGKAVIVGQEQYFPECYEGDCPYWDYYGECKAIKQELEED